MFFIMSTAVDVSLVGRGTFHCIRCGLDRPFAHFARTERTSVYFIPVGPTPAGEFVRCDWCDSAFNRSVLFVPLTPALGTLTQLAMRAVMIASLSGSEWITDERIAAAVAAVRRSGSADYTEEALRAELGTVTAPMLADYLAPLGVVPRSLGAARFLDVVAWAMASGGEHPTDRDVLAASAQRLGYPDGSPTHWAADLASPPDGWYADPAGRSPFRWWDGVVCRWTDHVASASTGPPPLPAPAAGLDLRSPHDRLAAAGIAPG